MALKNDPIQGIFFKKEPLLLQQKANQRRARSVVLGNATNQAFFDRLRSIKTNKSRLSRRPTESTTAATLDYEYVPVHKSNSKKIRFTVK